MIDDIRLQSEKLHQAKRLDAIQTLELLQQSEVIRMVLDGKYTPKDLDKAYRNMKAQIVKLQNEQFTDKAEIMRLRRYIELITYPEVEK